MRFDNASNPNTSEYAVIGGGATGTMFFIHLAKSIHEGNFSVSGNNKIRIHFIDPNGPANGGLAYGRSPGNFLNEIAACMTPAFEGEFVDFCAENGHGGDPWAFHERSAFHQYELQKYAWAVRILGQNGVEIVERNNTAQLSRQDDGKFKVILDGYACGRALPHDFLPDEILLAPGYGKRQHFKCLERYAKSGYIPSIYPNHDLLRDPHLQKDGAKVLIVGTGPGMFDALKHLKGSAYDVEISAVSRNGLTPKRRDTNLERDPKTYEHPLSVETLKDQGASAKALHHAIINEIERAWEEQGIPERQAALTIQKDIRALLEALSIEEQKAYSEFYIRALYHKCTPVPPFAYDLLNELGDRDNRRIYRASLSEHNFRRTDDGRFEVTFDCGETRVFDAVINCAGHNPTNIPIINSLIEQGAASRHPGLGVLETENDGYHLKGCGIACIGPSTHFGLHGVEAFSPYVALEANRVLSRLIPNISMSHINRPPSGGKLQLVG